jgi:hypothetical protein
VSRFFIKLFVMEKSYLCQRRRPREETEGSEKGLGLPIFRNGRKDRGADNKSQQDHQCNLGGPSRQMTDGALFEFVVGTLGMKVRSLYER